MDAAAGAAAEASVDAPVARRSEFKVWEKFLIVASILLFLGSMYLYVTDYPLRRYLFNIDDEGRGHPVGTVSLKAGGLRRQFNGSAEFKSIELAEELYDEDTLVTGSDSTAILKLDDGSSIEMAPNTMVRLHFQTNLTLGGISRAATVDVVAGTVKPTSPDQENKIVIRKTAKPIEIPKVVAIAPKPLPKATPEPLPIKGVELIMPRQGTQLALDRGTQIAEKPLDFTWRVTPPDRSVQLTLWKRLPGSKRTQIYQDVLKDQGGQGVLHWILKNPGQYQWELRGPKGEAIRGAKKTIADFTLAPDFEAIEPQEPLVGGEVLASSKLTGKQMKNFDITLRWKPYPGADRYRITVRTQSPTSRAVLEKTVREPQYLFNKDKVFSGQIFYDVASPLESGFVVHSTVKPFLFTFLAPVLVTPVNHVKITKDELEDESNTVLITWQKTNFTEWYDLQIAKDAEFTQLVQNGKQKENFFIFRPPGIAKYYWRVRSYSKSVLSPYSSVFDINLVP